MLLIVLVLHSACLIGASDVCVRRFFPGLPWVLHWVVAVLFGYLLGMTATYALACAMVFTGQPLLWSAVISSLAASVYIFFFRTRPSWKAPAIPDILAVAVAVLFSSWLMIKTFRGDGSGTVYVGSNNVFDFGFAVGLIRSISWGNNIPFESPFFAGLPLLYHFLFVFWEALWEYFGVPLMWAVNIPSIVSFSSMLLVLYFIPQLVGGQKYTVGFVTMLLTVTSSSLTFWQVAGKQDIWHLSTYPFAGPFDGSTISIFTTLNSYVNQRHLAFGIAVGLLMFLLASITMQKRKLDGVNSLLFGTVSGILVGWNMFVTVFLVVLFSSLFIRTRQWRQLLIYLFTTSFFVLTFFLPLIGWLAAAPAWVRLYTHAESAVPQWSGLEYLWQNLGVLPFVAFGGYFVLPKKVRRYYWPWGLIFFFLCLAATVGKRGFEQKSFSFFVHGMNILAAIGVVSVWHRRHIIVKFFSVGLLFVLTVSGVVNLFPIKNEFAFPLMRKEMLALTTWIRQSTPQDTIFVSYEDIIDPVVLAGRKNYYGFYKNIGQYDRTTVVRSVYSGDIRSARAARVSYVLVPKWEKNYFPYIVDRQQLSLIYKKAYEDDRFVVFAVE